MISRKIDQIRSRIQGVCARLGCDPNDITIVAVTKYTDSERMQEAVEAGITDIAENRVQDAKKKFALLADKGVVFKRHMIGHLQTNKVKDAVKIFDMIQSVDSVKVAGEIEKQAARLDKTMEVLLQVNSSGEEQKSGVEPGKAAALLNEIAKLEHIRVRGLMTIGLFTDDRDAIRPCFEKTKEIFDQAAEVFRDHPRVNMTYLSMGMTQDYDLAVECGANMVRIGSAIFTS